MLNVEFRSYPGTIRVSSFDELFMAVDAALERDPDKRRAHQAEVICRTVEEFTNQRVYCVPDQQTSGERENLRFILLAS